MAAPEDADPAAPHAERTSAGNGASPPAASNPAALNGAAAYPWRAPRPTRRLDAELDATRRLTGRRAGIVTRSIANTLDAVVVLLILVSGYLAVAAANFLLDPRGFQFPAPSFGLVLFLGGVVQGLYFAVFWLLGGQTYGDRVLGIRVVAAGGGRLGPLLAALRAYLCVILPIGLLWVAVSRHNRSVQDVLLRTSVVYDWTHQEEERPGA
ncbi:MAG TPA: RDD family protein [Jatrophihabitans sp.]|nr:RDD family protein [Jatrophihabitans sp.]